MAKQLRDEFLDFFPKPCPVEKVGTPLGAHFSPCSPELRRENDELRRLNEELRTMQGEWRGLADALLARHDEQRRETARQVHDEVTQPLVVLGLAASEADQMLASPESASSAVREIKEQIAKLMSETQRISNSLYPSVLNDFGLAGAVKGECRTAAGRYGLVVDLECGDLPKPVHEGIALCLYGIVQTALRSVAKHARRARVALNARAGGVLVVVHAEQIGTRGIIPDHDLPELAAIGQRLRLMRGMMSVYCRRHGIRIEAWAPMERG